MIQETEIEISVSDVDHSGFSQTHKIGNIGINVNFVVPYIYSFVLYLQTIMLFNVKLGIIGCIETKFQGHRPHLPNSFLIAQLKWSWQIWQSRNVFLENPILETMCNKQTWLKTNTMQKY